MAKIGRRSQAKLDSVDDRLGDIVARALRAAPAWLDFAVISGTRTDMEQAALYRKGRTEGTKIVTYCDGYRKKSRHQPKVTGGKGEAVDIAAFRNGKITWDDAATAAVAGFIVGYAKARGVELTGGVEWGWDYGHLQLKD